MLRRLPTDPTDEPILQRVQAHGRLRVKHAGGRSRIDTLVQEGAAKIRMPRVHGDPLEAILINTAGGLTGGDQIAWAIDVDAGASASITTQTCEKVYRSAAGHASVATALSCAPGGSIAWLPQETIVYDRSALRRRLDVSLEGGSRALLLESIVFGRLAMGEQTAISDFRDRWRVKVDGKLIHAEDLAFGSDVDLAMNHRAGGGGNRCVATLLLVGEDAPDHLVQVRSILGDSGAVSAWRACGTGKLLARVLARDSYALRKTLVPLVGLLNGEAGLPKVWSL